MEYFRHVQGVPDLHHDCQVRHLFPTRVFGTVPVAHCHAVRGSEAIPGRTRTIAAGNDQPHCRASGSVHGSVHHFAITGVVGGTFLQLLAQLPDMSFGLTLLLLFFFPRASFLAQARKQVVDVLLYRGRFCGTGVQYHEVDSSIRREQSVHWRQQVPHLFL